MYVIIFIINNIEKVFKMDLNKIKATQIVGLDEKLKSNKKLTVKLGFDPTSPDLHLGHYVVLRFVKQLQDLNHKIVLVVGDFTASIGDPSGRSSTRPVLSMEQIEKNAQTYINQLGLVVDLNKVEIKKNSSWLSKIDATDMIKYMSKITVSQMLSREDFKNRYENNEPISLHEFTYPIMQALDSVFLDADLEIGGTDQTFNLMIGRQLQKALNKEEQAVVTFPILVGLDGVKKMSKSLNNYIGLTASPEEKFGLIMSVSDETMFNYFEILIGKTEDEINQMKSSNVNPMLLKIELAKDVVAIFHGNDVANIEKDKFVNKFSKKTINEDDLEIFEINESEIQLFKLIHNLGFSESMNDSRRKIEQGGVKINNEKVTDKNLILNKHDFNDYFILKVGKVKVIKCLFK